MGGGKATKPTLKPKTQLIHLNKKTTPAPCPHTDWTNENAGHMLCALTAQLGQPSVLGPEEGGIAIWRDPIGSGVDTITLRDEAIQHRCPAPHEDFLYSSVNVRIPPERVEDVQKLSGSVNYDPLKQELTARCGSLEANIATLSLATGIAAGVCDIDEVHEKGLYGQTIEAISCNVEQDAECAATVAELHSRLQRNRAQIPPNPALDYYEGAFDAECGDPDA